MTEAYRIRGLLSLPSIVHIYLIALGVSATLWAFQVFPASWHDPAIERMAGQIIAGQIYKISDLIELVPSIEKIQLNTLCRPASLRSAAVVRLRLTEESIKTGDRPNISKTLDELIVSVRNSLKCAPSDPFLWLVLYWAENTRFGIDSRYLNYLRLSYALGPYEGWVALKRSQFALAAFEQLPPEVAEQALNEFVGLVNSGFYQETAELLVGPGWHIREKILPRLITIAARHRVEFEKAVYQLGQSVDVPGIDRPEARPWGR